MKARWNWTALSAVALLLLPALLVVAAEDKKTDKKKKDPLAGIKCPLSGEKIDKEATAAHNDGTVYFCCKKCVASFEKKPDKHITKANYQLVATKQFEQKVCPFTEKEVKDGTQVKVGYAELKVGFCCKNCQGKAKKAKEDVIALIFGKKVFAKSFEIIKEEDGKKGKKKDKKEKKA